MSLSDIVLPLHLMSLAFVAWNVVLADHMGFNWIRGKEQTLEEQKVRKYHIRTWIGLFLMIATGFTLFWPAREYLLTRTEFYVKMGFVVALFLNSFAIGRLSKISTEKTFASLSTKEKIPLIISGAISTISWIGAGIMALFLFP